MSMHKVTIKKMFHYCFIFYKVCKFIFHITFSNLHLCKSKSKIKMRSFEKQWWVNISGMTMHLRRTSHERNWIWLGFEPQQWEASNSSTWPCMHLKKEHNHLLDKHMLFTNHVLMLHDKYSCCLTYFSPIKFC